MPILSEDGLGEALYKYYSAFDEWIPDDLWLKGITVSAQDLAGIRGKYRAFDDAESP